MKRQFLCLEEHEITIQRAQHNEWKFNDPTRQSTGNGRALEIERLKILCTNKIFNPEFSIQSNYQSRARAWNKAISSVSLVHLIKKLIYLLAQSKLLEDMLWQDQEVKEEKQDLGPRDKNVH